jgi:hypothetical protein
MLFNIGIAACMLVVTTAIHAGGMLLAIQAIKSEGAYSTKRWIRIYRVSGIVILMFLASLLEVLAWAIAYLALNAKESVYAFFFNQKGLMAGLGLQGSKITKITPDQ